MSAYNKTIWVDRETIVDSTKFRKIENALQNISRNYSGVNYGNSYTVNYTNSTDLPIIDGECKILTVNINESIDSHCIASFYFDLSQCNFVEEHDVEICVINKDQEVIKSFTMPAGFTENKDYYNVGAINIPYMYIPLNENTKSITFVIKDSEIDNKSAYAYEGSISIIIENLSGLNDLEDDAQDESYGSNLKMKGDIWFGPSQDNNFNPCKNEEFIFDDELLVQQNGMITFTNKKKFEMINIPSTERLPLGGGFKRSFVIPNEMLNSLKGVNRLFAATKEEE